MHVAGLIYRENRISKFLQHHIEGLTLAISRRCEKEAPEIPGAWINSGGYVEIIDRFWTNQGIVSGATKLYGSINFCQTVAGKSGIELISPNDELLAQLGRKWTKRSITVRTLSDLLRDPRASWPRFLKPVTPKEFAARVFTSREDALSQLSAKRATKVLCSEVVIFESEARAFISEGKVTDCQFYSGYGDSASAKSFAQDLAEEYRNSLPEVYVVDVGRVGDEWAVIEFNAAWASHPLQCRPSRIVTSIAGGTREVSL